MSVVTKIITNQRDLALNAKLPDGEACDIEKQQGSQANALGVTIRCNASELAKKALAAEQVPFRRREQFYEHVSLKRSNLPTFPPCARAFEKMMAYLIKEERIPKYCWERMGRAVPRSSSSSSDLMSEAVCQCLQAPGTTVWPCSFFYAIHVNMPWNGHSVPRPCHELPEEYLANLWLLIKEKVSNMYCGLWSFLQEQVVEITHDNDQFRNIYRTKFEEDMMPFLDPECNKNLLSFQENTIATWFTLIAQNNLAKTHIMICSLPDLNQEKSIWRDLPPQFENWSDTMELFSMQYSPWGFLPAFTIRLPVLHTLCLEDPIPKDTVANKELPVTTAPKGWRMPVLKNLTLLFPKLSIKNLEAESMPALEQATLGRILPEGYPTDTSWGDHIQNFHIDFLNTSDQCFLDSSLVKTLYVTNIKALPEIRSLLEGGCEEVELHFSSKIKLDSIVWNVKELISLKLMSTQVLFPNGWNCAMPKLKSLELRPCHSGANPINLANWKESEGLESLTVAGFLNHPEITLHPWKHLSLLSLSRCTVAWNALEQLSALEEVSITESFFSENLPLFGNTTSLKKLCLETLPTEKNCFNIPCWSQPCLTSLILTNFVLSGEFPCLESLQVLAINQCHVSWSEAFDIPQLFPSLNHLTLRAPSSRESLPQIQILKIKPLEKLVLHGFSIGAVENNDSDIIQCCDLDNTIFQNPLDEDKLRMQTSAEKVTTTMENSDDL